MKRVLWIILFLGVCYDSNAAQVDLSSWSNTDYSEVSGGVWPISWELSDAGQTVTQALNGDPTIYLNNMNQTSYTMEGTWQVKTTEDDDLIGFVFGYQDESHFYIFDWKQETQSYGGTTANEGLTVKKISAPSKSDLTELDFWASSADTAHTTILAADHGSGKGWADNTVYRFILEFNADGTFNIQVQNESGTDTIWDITVNDDSYTSGQFGFYNYSQEQVEYNGFTQTGGVVVDPSDDGQTGEPDDDGAAGGEMISIFSPSNNETVGYGSSGGKVTFSFSKITGASKYLLQLQLYDILTDTSIAVPVELIPPGTGNASTGTPGFSEQFIGMVYELALDTPTWDILALYDIQWGVEAFDDSGSTIGSTYDGTVASPSVYGLKFIASNAITMTSPGNGESLNPTDSAPTFQWDTYQGASTYTLILAHVGSLGFDSVLTQDDLTLNVYPMDDTAWQTMPTGTWYWTVFGYDAAGSQTPGDFTIFDFTIQ